MKICFTIISEEVKMNKFNLIFFAFLILIFMSWLSVYAPAYEDPGLEVVPLQHDFGDMSIGSSSTTIITISNFWWRDITIHEFSFQPGSSPDFSITSDSPTGSMINSGMSLDVEVTYTPSTLGDAAATIDISWTNGESGVEHVSLSGVGVESQPPPVTIEDVLAFFDESVEVGKLEGRGHQQFVRNAKLKAMRCVLMLASKFIEREKIAQACWALNRAYKCCDGNPWPPDFVIGDAVVELANMIKELRTSFECGSCQHRLYKDIAFDNNLVTISLEFSLEQNFPNPFNSNTSIIYQIQELNFVTLKVYDVLGNEVTILLNEERPAGNYEIEFDATSLPSGIYFYRLQVYPANGGARDFVETKKMVLMK
jgi:hypothetical protein